MPIHFKLILTALFWGGTFIAGRVLAPLMAPTIIASGRYAIAVALLLMVAWRFEGGLPRLNQQQVLTTFALGFSGIFLYNITFLIATKGDFFSLFSNEGQVFGIGEWSMICAATCWAVYTVLGRHALKGLTPIVSTTYAALWGFVLLLAASFLTPQGAVQIAVSWQAVAAMLYLGVFGTVVAFVLYYQGVKAIGPARTAVFNNLIPAFGVLLGTVLLGERLYISMIFGGALVIGGVALTNRRSS
jgi:drug/metabolite transporter (DMT)-like permease